MSDPKKPEVKAEPQLEARAQQQIVDIASAVSKTTLEAIMPSLLAMINKGQVPAPVGPKRHKSIFSRPKCSVCGWFAPEGKQECAEHELVVVYPTRNPEYGDWFAAHGIRISGVKFCSEHESHEIPVPKGMKSTLLEAVQNWESAEREMRNGKDKRRRGPSAQLSPNGARVSSLPPDSAIGWQ
jgi:hypothetical protein